MAIHHKVLRFRMIPTRVQAHLLCRQAGARRWVWNWALEQRTIHYKIYGKTIPKKQLSSDLTALKNNPDMAWLKEADAQTLQQTLLDQDRAFQRFFAKTAKHPKFKGRKNSPMTFRVPQRVKVDEEKVYVPKIGWVKIRQSMGIPDPTKSATFKRDASGNWFVAIVVEFSISDDPLPISEDAVGIDLGLKDFAVLSTGERIPAPKFFRRSQKRLRRAQRVLSRRQKTSRRRARAKQRVARIHQRTSDQRKDFIHKLTTRITHCHDAVCVETLNIRGLARTKLAKSILDAAWGEAIRQFQYKAIWNRKHLAQTPMFFRSTKECRFCGTVNNTLTLADRYWTCSGCLQVHDRDLHASHRIRDEGLRLLAVGHTDSKNARGVDVSPSLEGGRC